MGLIRLLFWVALFLVSTFVFTVIFEHGFANFSVNAQEEVNALKAMYNGSSEVKKVDAPKSGR